MQHAAGAEKFYAYATKVLAHGVAGGVMDELQGGRFGNGFASAGFAEALSPVVGGIESVPMQAIATSVVGGTASVLAGGKFANGAVTAAFGYAFGALARNAANGGGASVNSRNKSSTDFDGYGFRGVTDIEKVVVALDVARETCPAEYSCSVPSEFNLANLGSEIAARTSVFGAVTFNIQRLDFSLHDAARSFLDDVYHESMHRGNGFLTRLGDALSEDIGVYTKNHELIYYRATELSFKYIDYYYSRLRAIEEQKDR